MRATPTHQHLDRESNHRQADLTRHGFFGRSSRGTIIMRWDATATLLDGSAYRNHGVHVITMSGSK